MKQFSEVHLKAWKKDYQDLINKKRIKLNEENVWMLGKTNGVICFFLNEEIAYICHSKSIYQTLNDILNIKRSNELIKLIMIHDLGISENKINQKKISKALSNKIKKVIRNFEFSLLKISKSFKIPAGRHNKKPRKKVDIINEIGSLNLSDFIIYKTIKIEGKKVIKNDIILFKIY